VLVWFMQTPVGWNWGHVRDNGIFGYAKNN
jgi:hypothetical protein